MNALGLITATVEPGSVPRELAAKQNMIKRQLTCKPWLERLASHIGGEVHLWPKSGIWYLTVQDKSFFLQAPIYPARSPEPEYKLLFAYSGPRRAKLIHKDYGIHTYEDLVRVVREVLGTVTATVEPGLHGFASHAKALEHATRHAGFDVDVSKDRIYAVYGEDAQAFVDLFVHRNKIYVSTYLECPMEDDVPDHTLLGNLTTETILNGYITRMDTRKLPGYLEALKDFAASLDPDWRHRHVSFQPLINQAKQVFK